MQIKYGEVTIIHNTDKEDIFSRLSLWLNFEHSVSKKSKYIFLFEDGEICDVDNKLKDLKFKFFNNSLTKMPIWFEKNKENNKENNRTYFYKSPNEEENNNCSLYFSKLFSSYSKFNSSMNIKSSYNSIYYCYNYSENNPELFGIMCIKSNESMPRFQFAYDADEFTREEVIYLINNIFNS